MTGYDSQIVTVNQTIASGASLTDGVHLGGLRLFGIVMPSTWTAANLTFQVSYDGDNYYNFYDADGNEITVTASASRAITLDPALFSAVPYVKVRSGTSGTPVNQVADRTLTLVLRNV